MAALTGGRGRRACAGLIGVVVASAVLGASSLERRAGTVRRLWRPDPQTYHWVLPAHHVAVEVVELHPGDCYVIQRVDGVVYFGEPPPGVLELQRHLGDPVAHLVESLDDHPECLLSACLELARLTDAITTRLLESGDRRARRTATHRPSPLDNMRGGAYSDVGSAERSRYRQTPEQRMVYLHLRTAGRDNCYEAQVPRTLTIHIRDRQPRPDRTGVYTGYLYLEHHHDAPPERVAIRGSWEPPPPTPAIPVSVRGDRPAPCRCARWVTDWL